MGSIGAPEILVILVLALLVLGPERLPQAARTAGKWLAEARKLTSSLQAEVQTVVDEVMQPVQTTAAAASDAYVTTASTVAAVAPVETAPNTTSTTDLGAVEGTWLPEVGTAPPFDPSLN
jgi:Tat protein translocase TatB subunit